jgi:hypothetical protein
MMDGLSKFEESIGKPRTKWSKADWQMVAHELAGVRPKEARGRPRLTDEQKNASEQNLLAAEFWRDETTEKRSVFDGDVGTIQNRKTKLRQNTATKEVVRVASQLNVDKEAFMAYRKGGELREGKLEKKADALVRAIQVMKKNRREK